MNKNYPTMYFKENGKLYYNNLLKDTEDKINMDSGKEEGFVEKLIKEIE